MPHEVKTRRLTGPETFAHALADVQDAVEAHRDAVHEFRRLLQPAHSPGDLRTVKLTAAQPTSDAAAAKAKSFTIVNPYSLRIGVGPGGISAGNVAAIDVPATSWMTFPITAENLEIGVDAGDVAQLAGGDVYIFVFLYDAPRPFAAGVLA